VDDVKSQAFINVRNKKSLGVCKPEVFINKDSAMRSKILARCILYRCTGYWSLIL
jgi:hypothetical protein